MKPDYVAAQVAENMSGALMVVGGFTMNLWWCALGLVLNLASAGLVHYTRTAEV